MFIKRNATQLSGIFIVNKAVVNITADIRLV